MEPERGVVGGLFRRRAVIVGVVRDRAPRSLSPVLDSNIDTEGLVFTESAELYDAIYSTLKDYSAEAAQIANRLRAASPRCSTVLDVGCGTGEHARLLATQHGFQVEGIDLSADFVRLAQKKNPYGVFHQADMVEFALRRRFDAVICLFSSIGYVCTLDRVVAALCCFREHLAVGGVVLVEPWFEPGDMQNGHHSVRTAEAKGLHVTRAATTEIAGRISRLRFDYTIRGAEGERRVTEFHELGLFTKTEMLKAFDAAGLVAQYEKPGPSGRGLYVARVAA